MRGAAAAAAMLLAALTAGGCGYTVRRGAVVGVKAIAVPTFGNETHEHLLEAKVTSAVMRELVFDGSVRVADAGLADALLEGTVVNFERLPSTLGADDTDVEEYRVRVTVTFSLRLQGASEALWKEEGVWGDATYHLTGALARGEEEALEDALRDLARKVVEKTVRRW